MERKKMTKALIGESLKVLMHDHPFEKITIKMITDGNPGHKTESVLTWMYYKAFSTGEFGYSAALSFIIAVVLGILAVVQFRMMDHSKLD